MKSKKNEELNFLYLDEKCEENDKKKIEKQKKGKQKGKNRKKETKQNEEEKNLLDNEIIIGVTKPKKEQKQQQKPIKKQAHKKNKNTSKKVVANKKKGADRKSAPQNIRKTGKKTTPKLKKKNLVRELIKWTILLNALMASIVFFMMSPLFDIAEITVTGNSNIANQTIISLSGIQIGENIYKTSNRKIISKMKQNAYIEQVEINRILPNKIELIIKERITTYMLEYANSFVYINNQGYILEKTDTPLDVPILEGYQTPQEEIQVGNRLNQEDLSRLETVLKIKDSVQSNNIISKINRVNIQDKQNYILQMEEEKKTIYLGDASNLSTRMLYVKAALQDTKGLQGEIFVNGDFVKEKAFFRPSE